MTETSLNDPGMEEPLILERLSDLQDQGEYIEHYPDIRGRAVVNPLGDEVGMVDDLYVDPRKRNVVMAAITFSGAVGYGGKRVLVPVRELRLREDEVRIMTAEERIRLAPEFHPGAPNYEPCCEFWSGEVVGSQEKPEEGNVRPPGRLELEDEDEFERSLTSEQ